MRQFVRHPSDIPIHIAPVEAVDNAASSCLSDVSLGGLSCSSARPIRVGAEVAIDINSVTPPYHGRGEVMWCRAEGMGYEVGISFLDTEESFKARMVQQVCQIEHYKNAVYQREGRLLDGEQAANEWIAKYAEEFD